MVVFELAAMTSGAEKAIAFPGLAAPQPFALTMTPSTVVIDALTGSATGICRRYPEPDLLKIWLPALAISSSRNGKNVAFTIEFLFSAGGENSISSLPSAMVAAVFQFANLPGSAARADRKESTQRVSGEGVVLMLGKVIDRLALSGMQTSLQTSQSAFAASVIDSPDLNLAGVCMFTKCRTSPS